MSFRLILSSYTKFELSSLRNNEIAMKLLITDIFGCRDKVKVRNDVIFNNGYDVMSYFAKCEKFSPHNIIIPSFRIIGSQMPELDQGGYSAPHIK